MRKHIYSLIRPEGQDASSLFEEYCMLRLTLLYLDSRTASRDPAMPPWEEISEKRRPPAERTEQVISSLCLLSISPL
ncbi:uncharacterized protein ARMOST_08037 [Armillaria ostoyae]|uniref:Uncharacterized protein n=1 Tax=Armillaria ostoyae TaxID=47428 RepID=A0A284R7G1_ARMOS|nr:uncharacterized protein ARMOST_08037 [Armillaria ostoyae]